MTARVLCPALDAMLKKTIIALCEVNVQYNVCLEISGSLHIRADGERVFNCLIEEELNGKEKEMRKESLNDLAGFSIDLAKLHRDSMDSFTERDDEFETDDLSCFNLPQGELRTDLTSEDEATLVEGSAQQDSLEISSTSSSQCSKSPAIADMAAAASISDLNTATAASNVVIPTLPVSQARTNLAAIFPTPKIDPNTMTSIQNQLPVSTYQTTIATSTDNKPANPLPNPIAAAASANPNLNLQAVAIAAALQRAAEASKRNIGMVLPTQSKPLSTQPTSTACINLSVDNNQLLQNNETIQNNPVTVKEEQTEGGDLPLPPLGLNFQLALFQNQMAQIQMMQAANASAMLNMGTNVGLNTLNTGANLNVSNAVNTAALGTGLGGGLNALTGSVNAHPVVTSSAPAQQTPAVTSAVSTQATSKSSKSSAVGLGNPVRTTTGAKKWQCGFCGILVSSKFYLSSHINAVHTRTRIYPCEICGRLFYSHGAQRIHKLRYHWVDKRHKCPQCNQMFVLPVELRQHIQRKHKHALM